MQTSLGHTVVVVVYQLKIGFRDFWMDFLEIVSIFACSPVLWTMENGAKIIDFLDLGNQPLANSYIESKNINKKERKYRLIICS